jgi:hypothetical protein
MSKNAQLQQRFFADLPDRIFDPVVKQFAFYSGKPCFTIWDLRIALINYSHVASKLN